ncbi:MAG: tyrosine--tRNA ligase, partial [Nanoarchaeota archaeon]|nr:tyrosine--tRNA ligase [Nanoarchaeota archaeon]
NFKTYKKQAEKILDFSKIQVKYNSEWLKKLTFSEIIKLAQQFSFGDFASRELIKKRLSSSKHVGLHEGLYPAMQGYDSYFLDTDVQIGGTDQTFNMQAGRILQKNWRKKESFILTNEFLLGTDGRKMSKTWDNAIWLDDNPNDMYAKIMAINDDLIIQYFTLATDLPMSAIRDIEQELKKTGNPINAKKDLARQIVKELHGEKEAEDAENNFEKTVQHKELPEEIELLNIDASDPLMALDILINSRIVPSRSEAKRLIQQNAITIDGKKITDSNFYFKDGQILRIGKRQVFKIKAS